MFDGKQGKYIFTVIRINITYKFKNSAEDNRTDKN